MVVAIVRGAVAVALCTVGTAFMVNAYRGQHIGVWRAYAPISIRWLWVGGMLLLLCAADVFHGPAWDLTGVSVAVGIVVAVVVTWWFVPILVHNAQLTPQHPDAVTRN